MKNVCLFSTCISNCTSTIRWTVPLFPLIYNAISLIYESSIAVLGPLFCSNGQFVSPYANAIWLLRFYNKTHYLIELPPFFSFFQNVFASSGPVFFHIIFQISLSKNMNIHTHVCIHVWAHIYLPHLDYCNYTEFID